MKHTRDECEKTFRVYLLASRGIKLADIDATIQAARDNGDIEANLIQRAIDARERCLTLMQNAYGKGADSMEFSHVMDVGQTLFEIADRLNGLMQLHPLHVAHRKVVAGGRKGAERKKQETGDAELRPRILEAINSYSGDPRNMASIVARKFGCTATYVRQIRKAK